MAIQARLFDGTVLQFPDGTSPDVINKVAAEQTATIKKAQPAPAPVVAEEPATAATPTPEVPGTLAPSLHKNALEEIGFNTAPPVDTLKAAPPEYQTQQEYRMRPGMSGAKETAQELKRAGALGFHALAQAGGGQLRFIQDMFGVDSSNTAESLNKINNTVQAIGTPASHPQAILEGALSSITQQLPAMGAGIATGSEAIVLGDMFLNSFGQTYDDSRRKDLDIADSTARAAAFAAFEVAGEKFGLGDTLKGLKAAAKGIPTDKLSDYFAKALVKEIPGEELTYTGQFATDKAFKINPEAGFKDFIAGAVDTMQATIVQGGLTMGAGHALNSAVNKIAKKNPEAVKEGEAKAEETATAPVPTPATTAAAPVSAEQKLNDRVVQLVQFGIPEEYATKLAQKEVEDAGRTEPGATRESVEVLGQPAGEPTTGGAAEPIGTAVAGTGIPTGTTEEGTVPQPAPLETAEEEPHKQRYADFLGRAFKRQLMESKGQDILDTMEENDVSPKDVADKFWKDTYFNLPAPVQERFNKELKAATGMEPGSVTHVGPNGEEVRAKDWHDIADLVVSDMPNKAEHLEGSDRGFTVLMDEANRRFAEQPAEQTTQPTAEEVVQQIPEQAAPQEAEQAAPQVSERERAAAERLRQQQEEAAAEKAAALEEVKQEEAKRLARQAQVEGKVAPVVEEEVAPEEEIPTATTPEEDANFEKAKDNVGAFVRQNLGGVQNIAPEDVVSAGQALASLVDIMHHVIKKGARNFAQAMANARQGLGVHGNAITKVQFKTAYDAAKARIKAEPKPAKKLVDRVQDKIDLSHKGTIVYRNAPAFTQIAERLRAYAAVVPNRVRKVIAYDTSTDFNVDMLTRAGVPHMQEVNKLLSDMAIMRGRILKAVSDIQERWERYAANDSTASMLLNDAQLYNTLNQISPTEYPTVLDAIANDAEFNRLKEGLENAESPQSAAAYKGKISTRLNEIKNAYEKWDKLDAEGKEIYKQLKEFYKAMFMLRRAILDDQIAKSSVPGSIDDVSTPKGRLAASIRQTLAESNILEEYFPLMRHGNYWVRFGKGKNEEVYRFETDVEAAELKHMRLKELQDAGDTRTWEERKADGEASMGEDIEGTRRTATEASHILKKSLEIIDSNAKADKDELKDALYQLYLETLPERSFRKTAKHRKGTAGFNLDMRRNFVMSGYNYASQLSRLRYGAEIQNELSSARAALEGDTLEEKVAPFLNEVEIRVGEALTPPNEDNPVLGMFNGIAQTGFAYTLSAPVSWIMNITSVPTFGYWTLARYYGAANAAKALAKYGNVVQNFAMHKFDAHGNKVFVPISVGESNHVKRNPILKAAFKQLVATEITEKTNAHELLDLGRKPSREYLGGTKYEGTILGRAGAAVGGMRRGARFGVKALGYGFHHSERIIREAMVMSGFELAYEKAVADGLEPGANKAAFNRALDEAYAHTKTAMFNYETVNRPRIMRRSGILGPIAPLTFQFKMYTEQALEFQTKSFLDMFSKLNTPEEKYGAAMQFFGSLLTALFMGGFAGFYEIDDILTIIQKILNNFTSHKHAPLTTRDIKFWYRNVLMPNLFGDKWSQILDKGPISAISNVDIATRASMDFGMFHDGGAGSTWQDDLMSTAQILGGATFSLTNNMVRGVNDISQGHYYEGIEKMLPKLLSNPIVAYQWSQEGIKDEYSGNTLIKKQDISRADIVWRALGFSRTDLDMIKDRAFRLKGMEKQIDTERTNLLRALDLEARKGDSKGFKMVLQEVNAYNKANATPEKLIWPDTIVKSLETAAENRAYAKEGLQLNNELQQIIYKSLTHIPVQHHSQD